MIYACPFCGRRLWRIIRDGIATCNNCDRVFDTTPYHRILAAAWMARLHNFDHPDTMQASFELTDCEMSILKKYVLEEGYSHDELLKIIDRKTCLN